MPTKRRGTTTSASPSSDTGTSPDESAPPVQAAVPVPRHPADHAATSGEQALTIRLPFLTVSLTRPAGPPTPQAAPRSTPTVELPASGRGPRLLFYTGVAALGVAGVVEWPVAAAIAAGTYIASKARSTPTQPPSPGPRETASA